MHTSMIHKWIMYGMYTDIQEVMSTHKSISVIIQNYLSCIHVGIVSYSSTSQEDF